MVSFGLTGLDSDPPEHRPLGQAGGLLPQFEGADGAELGITVDNFCLGVGLW